MDSLSDRQIAKTNAQKKRNFRQYVVRRIESFSPSFVFFLWLFNKSSESKLTRRRKEQQRFVLLGVVSFHSSSSFSSFLNNQNDSHFAQTRADVSLWTSSSSHLDHTCLVHSSVGKETSRRSFSPIVVRHTDASHSHAYIPDRSPIVHGCGLLGGECNLQLIERIETERSRSALVLCEWSSTSSLRGNRERIHYSRCTSSQMSLLVAMLLPWCICSRWNIAVVTWMSWRESVEHKVLTQKKQKT